MAETDLTLGGRGEWESQNLPEITSLAKGQKCETSFSVTKSNTFLQIFIQVREFFSLVMTA